MNITLPELEDAINYWRGLRPSSGVERALSPEVNALAVIYASMIFHHLTAIPQARIEKDARVLLDVWRRHQQPEQTGESP